MKKKDERILALLRENSRISVTELSKRLGIPDTTVHYRMKKLSEIIKKYTVLLDYEAIGLSLYLLRIDIERYVLNKVTEEIIGKVYDDLSKKENIVSIFRSEDTIFVIIAAEELTVEEFDYPGVKNIECSKLNSFELV